MELLTVYKGLQAILHSIDMDFLDIHIWSWTLFRIIFLSAVHTPGSIIYKEDFMNRIHLYSNNNSATTTSAASATASGVRLEPVATVLLDNTTFFYQKWTCVLQITATMSRNL